MTKHDVSKIIAFCISYVESEIQKRVSLLEDAMPAEADFGALSEDIIQKTLDRLPVTDLPKDIVYESHLSDSISSLRDSLTEANEKTAANLKDLIDGVFAKSEDLHEAAQLISKSLSTLREQYDQHDHSQYSVDGHDHEQYVIHSALDEAVASVTEQILSESKDRHTVTEQLASDVQIVIQNTADLIKELSSKTDSAVSDLEASISDLDDRLSNRIGTIEQQLKDKLKTTTGDLETLIQNKCNRLEQISAKVNHTHDNYSGKDHTHAQYATVQKVSQLDQDITVAHQLIHSTDKQIKELLSQLKTKIELGDALTKEDLDQVSVKIKEEVLSNISLPEDGKDAHEWIFQWHPQVKGRLMFRREDQKEWKQQDLLVKTNNPLQTPAFGGFGGGAGDGSSLTVLNNGNLIEGNVKELDFRGALNVIRPSSGIVRVTVDGGGGSGMAAPYERILSGTDVIILEEEHGRIYRPTVEVFNPEGNLVITDVQINTTNSVRIRSLIDLSNHIAIIR